METKKGKHEKTKLLIKMEKKKNNVLQKGLSNKQKYQQRENMSKPMSQNSTTITKNNYEKY